MVFDPFFYPFLKPVEAVGPDKEGAVAKDSTGEISVEPVRVKGYIGLNQGKVSHAGGLL
jgi:hypothetical protein